MKSKQIPIHSNFIGRRQEQEKLLQIAHSPKAQIIVMYGRRRVGKTELLEQTFRDRNILKFEGVEGLKGSEQLKRCYIQLGYYLKKKKRPFSGHETWMEFFKILADALRKGIWTLYFEEVQWLADQKDEFISDLKWAWDNHFRHHPKLLLILCGSSPSFLVNKVLHSKALYNRSMHEFHLKELSVKEVKTFLGSRSHEEVMEAYLTVGGIPEYLKYLKEADSVFLGICQNAFSSTGLFVREYDRIFTSSLSSNKHYQKILDFLSRKKFSTRDEIAHHLGISSGGEITKVLEDLERCTFIERNTPYFADFKSLLVRYGIRDYYIQFYNKFIRPQLNRITLGDFDENPGMGLDVSSYQKWLGLAFERFCRSHHTDLADLLGFASVRYRHGVFFNRKTQDKNPGFQMDLVFDRDDHVITLCEIKYQRRPVGMEVVHAFEDKIKLFETHLQLKKKSFRRVLIASHGVQKAVKTGAYFDTILTLDDFFGS
ncbi:MAG: ATP-binding protein [Chlamydiae bacterium]|nr:ATP-binding protein [Chlamydiota bacterium]MBI3266217.1 ATP-binding protein [Chlamydiota bacterium]